MENLVFVEGNLKAIKDLSDFGGANMWHLCIQTVDGGWENIQWMGVYNIQRLFKTKLPVF